MTTTETPRTDACPHCGSNTEVDNFFRTTCGNLLDYREGNHGKIAGQRTELCHEIEVSKLWMARALRAESEVERLRQLLLVSDLPVALVNSHYNPTTEESSATKL